MGNNCFIYIDDGISGHRTKQLAGMAGHRQKSDLTRADLFLMRNVTGNPIR